MGVWRSPRSIRENGVDTRRPKTTQETSAPLPQGHFLKMTTNLTTKFETPARRNFPDFAHWWKKNAILLVKTTSDLQSQGRFWLEKPINVDNLWTSKEPNLWEAKGHILKRGVENRGPFGRPAQLVDMHWCRIALKPLVLKPFADTDLCRSTVIEQASKDAKSRPNDSLGNKVRPRSEDPLFKNPPTKNDTTTQKFTKCKPHFRKRNKGFQKPQAANQPFPGR